MIALGLPIRRSSRTASATAVATYASPYFVVSSAALGRWRLATPSALASGKGDGKAIEGPADASLLLPKPPHFPARAKRIIFLGMEGAPSHVDTFDYKPKLQSDDGKKSPENEDRLMLGSTFKFQQYGHSGKWIAKRWVRWFKSMRALFLVHTGAYAAIGTCQFNTNLAPEE